jgi:hypothetical protein
MKSPSQCVAPVALDSRLADGVPIQFGSDRRGGFRDRQPASGHRRHPREAIDLKNSCAMSLPGAI